ncbi:MAG: hypothetical protein KGJ84_13555, partial [Elusimicrobia bacterium]|nr:hypothetical protein [Elusimicrobiota bacterium]
GQATTEVVLLFPLFMFFLFAFAKLFALLILVQKLEIASFYAARRWQLESHRNQQYVGPADDGAEGGSCTGLCGDIQEKVKSYIGYDGPSAGFLDLTTSCLKTSECSAGSPGVTIQRTQVWNVVTVTACTNPVSLAFYKTKGFVFCSTKYVPNRDRPIAFVLPGLNNGP